MKYTLTIIGARCPTLLERLLLGIKCIGFCAGTSPQDKENCAIFCGKELFNKLGRAEIHKALPPGK